MKLVAPSHPLRRRACTALLAAGILLMALGLRFWRIDAQSIWYDEGWSIHLAREGLAEALAQIAGPGHTHPPGYYLLLMGWVRLFGDGVLAVRGLSALLGSITVLALVALAREVYGDDRTGLLAAALAALAPAQIVYSQEVRMYALLGLCFVLLLALGSRYTSGEGRWSAWHWGALLLVEIVALYSHYLMAFPLLSLNLWVIGRLLSARRRLVRWLGAQAVALAALLPWLIFALGSLVEHETMGAQPLSLGAFLRETGAFLLGGHIALLGREPLYARFAALAAAALALVTLPLLARRQDKKGTAYLLLQIVLPLLLVFALMRARPGYHPRYVLILLWPMLVLLARGTVRLWAAGAWGRMGALCALGLWLATSSLAATALYTDPYYRRDEARATAVYLRQELPPDALILVPVDDWALRYYLLPQVENLREALATVLYLEVDRMSDEEVEALVSAERQERSTAALVRWHQGTSDHRGLLDYLLERAGAQVGVQHLPGYTVVRYALQDKPAPLLIVEQEARFEKLALLRAAIETDVPADDAVAVALTFNPLDDLDQDFKVSLEVTDQAGHPLARQDTLLEDREGEETGEWMAQVPVTTYHILPLTPGLAPLTYTVDVGVYAEEEPEGLDLLDQAGAPAGKRYVLGSIHLREPSYQAEEEPDRERLGLVPLSQSPPAEGASAQQLVLAAHSALAEGYDTGQMLDVLLEWHHVGTSSLPDLRPVLRLVREGVVLAAESAAPVYGQYPTDRWRPGEVVLDRRAIQVPLDAAEGPAIVQVVVEGYKPWTLGQIDIHRIARTFAPPSPKLGASGRLGEVAELVGYDLAVEAIRAGQEIPLTLYWRALSTPDIDYVVFTHLLSEKGELIAQHDGPPARGTRPTRGWLAGEYILDEHLLEWLKPDYRGVALLEVGLYDPATGTRLLTPEGDSRLLLGNGTMVR